MRYTALLLVALALVSAASALDLPPGVVQLQQYEQSLAASITFIIAFLAGAVSLLSPCGLVLLPTFFSFWFTERKKAVLMTGIFGLGMMLSFMIFGLIAGSVGTWFNEYRSSVAVISGVVLVLFSIMLFLNKGFSVFTFKLDHQKSACTVFTLGFFFSIGWSPCISPVIGGMVFLAASTGTALKGALLLGVFALGAIIPLLVLAFLSDRFDWANAKWVRGRVIEFNLFGTHVITHTYNIIASILLATVGIIMILDKGTTWVMNTVPAIVPWSMETWDAVNRAMLDSGLLTSTAGNVAGVVFVVVLVAVVLIKLRRMRQSN